MKLLWNGKNERVPVNPAQYSFDSKSREKDFIKAQFASKEEIKKYEIYRAEWYRRAKEFDSYSSPLFGLELRKLPLVKAVHFSATEKPLREVRQRSPWLIT